MAVFIRDLKYALRQIHKSPLFSFYIIAPLALGIGLSGAIFLLLDALLLRPLPVKDPHSLVRLIEIVQNLPPRSVYPYDAVEALQRKSTSFSDVIAYADDNAAVRDASGATRVRIQIVTGNYFTALNVQALYGRVLTQSDAFDSAASPPVVLSYRYWQSQFHGDAGAIGKTITLEDRPFTIAGVMPRQFNGLEVETTPDIRIPLAVASLLGTHTTGPDAYRKFVYSIAARLKPGVTLDQARIESAAIVGPAMDLQSARQIRDEKLDVQSIANGVSIIRPRFAGALILLMAGVGLLLAMICANVGGLLLARAAARRQETAVRLAIGATAGRLLRQWLTESLLLTAIGAIAGLWISFISAPLMLRAIPSMRDLAATALTLSVDLRPDARFFGFAFGLCIVCALLAGLPAALQATRTSLQPSLQSTRATARQPLRWTLVAIQIGLCTFLLAGAGLLISTFRHLRSLDPGFDRDHVVTFSLDPGMAHYTDDQAADLQKRLLASVRALPGVASVSTALLGVMRGTGMKTTIAPEGQIAPRSDFMNTSINAVSADYFDTMGMRLLTGRNLRPDEPKAKPQNVVVNQAFVRRFFSSVDPIGRKFGGGTGKPVSGDYQIAGVVTDAKYRSLREPIPPTIYIPQSPAINYSNSFIVYVRTKNRPEGIIEAVRKTLNSIDPRLPFYEVHTLAEEVNATLWAERLLAWLSSIFSIAAAILATLGIYATLAYAITRSRREIGIRVALGATPGDVLRLFSMRPVSSAAIGAVLGIGGFYIATPAFRSVLYDISPNDPAAIARAVGAVLFIAAAATLVAIRAAIKVEPAAILRDE